MKIVNPSRSLESCGTDAPPGCEHVLLQGNPETGASQHIYRFPAGFEFVKHWHVSNENLIMTQGSLTIAAEGTPETRLNVGDYLHIPAKVVHWGVCLTQCSFYLMVDGVDSFNVVESK
jgi:quercetin dioxygenase-like cupin family protein